MRRQIFSLDRAENRVIKAALEYLLRNSADSRNRRRIRALLDHLSLVSSTVDIDDELSKCVRNRDTASYERAVEWAAVFLNRRSFTSFSGSTIASALLFPMERVFEDYVAEKMAVQAAGGEWSCSKQDTGTTLFDDRKGPRLRPDLVLRRDQECVVLDTKWKVGDISRDDLYQMFAYGKRYKAKKVILIYPQVSKGTPRKQGPWIYTEDADWPSDAGTKSFSVEAKYIDLRDPDSEFDRLFSEATSSC